MALENRISSYCDLAVPDSIVSFGGAKHLDTVVQGVPGGRRKAPPSQTALFSAEFRGGTNLLEALFSLTILSQTCVAFILYHRAFLPPIGLIFSLI